MQISGVQKYQIHYYLLEKDKKSVKNWGLV